MAISPETQALLCLAVTSIGTPMLGLSLCTSALKTFDSQAALGGRLMVLGILVLAAWFPLVALTPTLTRLYIPGLGQ